MFYYTTCTLATSYAVRMSHDEYHVNGMISPSLQFIFSEGVKKIFIWDLTTYHVDLQNYIFFKCFLLNSNACLYLLG